MKITRTLTVLLLAIVATALAGVSACGSNPSPSGPSPSAAGASSAQATAQGGYGGGYQGGTPGGTPGSGTQGTVPAATLQAMLEETLQDEYHAENIYQRVLNDFGASTLPFANIVRAERTHAASITALLANRSWTVPASAWSTRNVPAFGSVQEACAAAATAEEANVALYDKYLKLSLPTDVQRVFQNNRRASFENHLPAFERCR